MKKRLTGKTNKNKEITTIVIIPESQEKTKTLRLSGFKLKLLLAGIFVLISIICTMFIVSSYNNSNKHLREKIQTLSVENKKQKELSDVKDKKIEALKNAEKAADKKISDFRKNFKILTESYISSQTGGLSSRSGNSDRSSGGYIERAKNLKRMLNEINAMEKTDFKGFIDLSVSKEKIGLFMDKFPNKLPYPGKIVSKFGYRKDPFTHQTRMHNGIDVDAPFGANVKASASGIVTKCGYNGGFGKLVVISHGNGIETYYAHNSKLIVSVGQHVKKGDIVAKAGSTGRSTGTHLHFEIRINGKPVNPLTFLYSGI